ncbi:MAG: hypothetical protein WKF30_15425 [Pyrinomonadaceae bacterium]
MDERLSAIPPIQLVKRTSSAARSPVVAAFENHRDAAKVVRVTTDQNERIVGIQIPQNKLWQVLRSIGITRSLQDPAAIYKGVLHEGEEITLAANLKLRRGRLHAEHAIELAGADPYKFAALRALGLINEQINWKQMFFVPANEQKGVEVITRLIASYPVIASAEQQEQPGAHEMAEPEATAGESAQTLDALRVIDLAAW